MNKVAKYILKQKAQSPYISKGDLINFVGDKAFYECLRMRWVYPDELGYLRITEQANILNQIKSISEDTAAKIGDTFRGKDGVTYVITGYKPDGSPTIAPAADSNNKQTLPASTQINPAVATPKDPATNKGVASLTPGVGSTGV